MPWKSYRRSWKSSFLKNYRYRAQRSAYGAKRSSSRSAGYRKYRRALPNLTRTPVKNHARINGVKSRLNNRPEHKFTESSSVFGVVTLNAINILFSLNGIHENGGGGYVSYFQDTIQGVGPAEYIGSRINALYFNLNFDVALNGNAADAPIPYAWFRLMILIPRWKTNIEDTNVPSIPVDNVSEIDTKGWNVQFDKVYHMSTGSIEAATATTNASVPRKFRLKLPCRQTINRTSVLDPNGDPVPTWQWTRDMFVVIVSDSSLFTINNLYVKFNYRDP